MVSFYSNIEVSLGRFIISILKYDLQMTSGGDLYHVGTSRLMCEANRWTGSCVMRFLPEGRSKQTMILYLCGSGEYTTVLRFSIRGSDAMVSAPFRTWIVEIFLEWPLMC